MIKKYFENFIIIMVASIVSSLIAIIMNEIGMEVDFDFSYIKEVMNIYITSIFYVFLIRKIEKVTTEENLGKLYFKVFVLNLVLHILLFIIFIGFVVIIKNTDGMFIFGALSVIFYCIKVILSLAIFGMVLKDEGIFASIKNVFKTNKKDLLKIVGYNLLLVLVLFAGNVLAKHMNIAKNLSITFLSLLMIELFTYFVFVANEELYTRYMFKEEQNT